ncbi:MAG: DUF2332 family protein [Pseudomonadota bacterium]
MTMDAGVRAHFLKQADACSRLGSPFTATLLELAAERLDARDIIGAKLLDWQGDPGTDALALRFAGALHALVLTRADGALSAVYPPHKFEPDALWQAVSHAMTAHTTHLKQWLDQPPQTNEIRRAAMLLPGLLQAVRLTEKPVEILEIGASAGLNLHLDRFGYHYGTTILGSADSTVQLAPEIRSAPPDLTGDLDIVDREGVDIAPLDPSDPDDRLRLMAYVWPDQPKRLSRLNAALDIAASGDVRVARQDAADAVARFAIPHRGRLKLLVHTIMWQYLPEATQVRIDASLALAADLVTEDAPIGRLSLEPGPSGHAELRFCLWPQGIDQVLAYCDFHGRWIDWVG